MIKIKARDSEYGMCYSCDKSGHKNKLYNVIAVNDETEYECTMGMLCLDCLSKLSVAIGVNKLQALEIGVRI